jgi:hypothetical protein
MPSTKSYDGECVGGSGNGFPITTADSYDQCINGGGAYRPYSPDAGHRVSALVFDDHAGIEAEANPFSARAVGARLMIFPICEAHRRTPRSRLLHTLDLLDSKFTDEVGRLLEAEPDLKAKVSRLVVDIAWVAARALSEEGKSEASGTVVSEDLFNRARELGVEIRSRTQNQELIAAVDDALGSSEEVIGVAVSELLAKLAHRATVRTRS